MNNARKALISIQQAPPGIPVGRFHPQLAIIADFFDTLVNIQIQNETLHQQLLEAHARFGKLLGDITTPPASKVDQARAAASKITCNSVIHGGGGGRTVCMNCYGCSTKQPGCKHA